MATNLKFYDDSAPPAGDSVDLVFSATAGIVDTTFVVGATLAPPRAAVLFVTPVLAYANGSLPPPVGTARFIYDNAVARGPANWSSTTWESGAHRSKRHAAAHLEALRREHLNGAAFEEAQNLDARIGAGFDQNLPRPLRAASGWGEGAPQGVSAVGTWEDFKRSVRPTLGAPFREATPTNHEAASLWKQGSRTHSRLTSDWSEGGTVRMELEALFRRIGDRRVRRQGVPWGEAKNPQAGTSIVNPPAPTPAPPAQQPCYVPPAGFDVDLVFQELWDGGKNLIFMCPGGTQPIGNIVVPVRRVYIVLNEVNLRRVDGNIPLHALGGTLTLDRDSWTWRFSASLPLADEPYLEPASFGEPVEIELTVNGAAYRLRIEDKERTRQFGREQIAIGCRGRAAILDAPYAPILQFGNPADRTAQQLMDDVLTINGSPLGWQVNWNLDDWLVPANVFSHSGSYISALTAIAAAAGGYLQPHATGQEIDVLPGYPVLPWEWGGVTADYDLPDALVTQERIRYLNKPQYNRVFLSGARGGRQAQVTRTGSAGDILAPMVTDSLLTHATASRQRGGTILADTGAQADVTLRLPVLEETGIILPGKFVNYADGSLTRLGLVRSVQVDIAFPEVWQQIQLETHL